MKIVYQFKNLKMQFFKVQAIQLFEKLNCFLNSWCDGNYSNELGTMICKKQSNPLKKIIIEKCFKHPLLMSALKLE